MKLFRPKIKSPGPPVKPVSRDDAREAADRDDELRRRRGGAADILMGAAGAEAGTTGKTQLG
jgi:hypothetical protein